ncbi:MAG: hypothetical protein HZA06_04340 [Nitrospirae bacterium]|nr:hypothetical protein [Nitrospirota bacterium]
MIFFRITLFVLILSIFMSSLIYSQNKSKSDRKDLKQEIISIFKIYIELNEDFKSSVSSGIGKSGKSYSVLREEVEKYAEDNYTPKLETLRTIVCRENDRELLSEFFKVLISTENSANEKPRWIVGDIYLCQSDLVISEVKLLKKAEQKIILNDLNFGFLNVTYNKEDKIQDYHKLKRKLDLLK